MSGRPSPVKSRLVAVSGAMRTVAAVLLTAVQGLETRTQ
jgi:hypothetical protein